MELKDVKLYFWPLRNANHPSFFVGRTEILLYFRSPKDQMDAVAQNKDIAFVILPIPAISASGTDPLRADSSTFLLVLL